MAIAVFRTVVLYLLIIVGIRLMGKRQIGELEPSELVFALVVSDLASVPMQDFGIPLLSGILPILTLFCVAMVLSLLTMRSVRFRALLCGRPSIIVADGQIRQREMRSNRFTLDELMEQLRSQGVTDLKSVKYAVLETTGTLSVLLRAPERPVTCRQAGLSPAESGLPVILINDGQLIGHNLTGCGLSRNWLDQQLRQHGVRRVQEVFLLTVDEGGAVCFVPKE